MKLWIPICASCLFLGACAGNWSAQPKPKVQRPPSMADRTKLCMSKPMKEIKVEEQTTKEELTEKIAANLPKLDEHPERFIPCFAYANFVKQDGQPIQCAVHYRFTIKTNMGPMEFSGVTQTNPDGFYAILLPESVDAEIILDKERR